VVSLVGVLAMFWVQYRNTGVLSFDMLAMEGAGFSQIFQDIWFLPVFLGFAVLGGIWPFHNWSPDGHVAAPTAVSMFHAGVLMKLGAFAALRVGIMLLPQGAQTWSWLIMLFAAIAVVYGAYIAFVQMDFKYMVGFSSVSHMGLVMLGFSTLNREGLLGSGLQMFSHGVMTALFFAVVGMIYDRAHTRQIPELGGMSKIMPFATIGFIIGGLVSMGMPLFSGFVAEFPIFMGVWSTQWLVAVIASVSIVITAAYIMRNIRQVFFGSMPEKLEGHMTDVTVLDKVAITTLCLFMIIIGLFPRFMVPMVQTGVENILRLLRGA
jgi:NADH-quinone oxidoreductase subunit M